jgi:hypothetical protein
MNITAARKTVRAYFDVLVFAQDQDLTRAMRKEINPALHALGLPTLGTAQAVCEYVVTLSFAQLAVIEACLPAAKKAPARKVPAPREVPEFIVRRAINRQRRAALAHVAGPVW